MRQLVEVGGDRASFGALSFFNQMLRALVVFP